MILAKKGVRGKKRGIPQLRLVSMEVDQVGVLVVMIINAPSYPSKYSQNKLQPTTAVVVHIVVYNAAVNPRTENFGKEGRREGNPSTSPCINGS